MIDFVNEKVTTQATIEEMRLSFLLSRTVI